MRRTLFAIEIWSVGWRTESNSSTALGNDNVGGLSFTYGLETDDTVGSSYVFNAHDASWITFVRGLFPACQTMYRNRESAGCFNSANFLAKMKAYQDTRPERLWVADAQRKYLRPYEDNETLTYIPMLAGKKTHQREQVKSYNAYYYASKYVSDFCTSQNIMVRGNTPTSGQSITVVPPANTATLSMYIDCYIVVASTSQNVVAKTRAKRGQSYVMDFSTIGSMGETELYFCTAPMITELSGLAHLYFKQNNFGMASNLQRLEIGSGIAGYSNPNLESLTIGNSKMLEYLDIRNCPNVTGALDLSGCLSLREVYLENTNFSGITFATGGLLEAAHLPSPTSITMRGLMYLEDLTLESTNSLSVLRVEDCEFVPTTSITIGNTTSLQSDYDIILTLIDASSRLSRVRLINVNWALSSSSILDRIYNMSGIDDDGYNVYRSVLVGDASVATIRQSQLSKFTNAWPYLNISYTGIVTQYLATFYNADGEPIYDVNGNAYVQWVDAGDTPYDPITMGYPIDITDAGAPAAAGYQPSLYNGIHYQDRNTGYIYYSDGSAWSVIAEAEVLMPALASTAQYDYTFSGWDGISTSMAADRDITASYDATTRTYTVRFYRDPSTVLRTITNVPYGCSVKYGSVDEICGYGLDIPSSENGYDATDYSGYYFFNMAADTLYRSDGLNWSVISYSGDIGLPSWTSDESSLVFRVFKGWDKSTSFITEDVDATAQWIVSTSFPTTGTEMCDMSVAQIYGICQAGHQDSYFEPLDYTDITLGHDYNFTNVDSITVGPKYYPDSTEETLTLTGITVDQFLSGGYYFGGSDYYNSDISLFDSNKAFTLAIDFTNQSSSGYGNLISANNASTDNFRIYSNGTSVYVSWGDRTSVTLGNRGGRFMIVIRHPAGSQTIYVYSIGSSPSNTQVSKYTLSRTTTIENEPLCIGAIDYHTSTNRYRYGWTGQLHWMKVWYGDIGDHNAYELAMWPHEKLRMEYWGKGKYEYGDGSGGVSKASFIANNILRDVSLASISSGYNGWAVSSRRTFLNNRFYNALPTEWKAIINPVVINSLAGNNSSSITLSNDKIYLHSGRELRSSSSGGASSPEEIGVDYLSPNIPWFVDQGASATVSPRNTATAQRIKWNGRMRAYALPPGNQDAAGAGYNPRVYDGTTPYIFYQAYTSNPIEPCTNYGTRVAPGSIWLNGSNYAYMYISQAEREQYNPTTSYPVSSDYGGGCWIAANNWGTRSASVSTSQAYYVDSTGYINTTSSSSTMAVCGFSI